MKLSAKKWLALFLLSAFLLAAGLALFNVLTDPFGAFGGNDEWWSYAETNNPRVAKMAYLEKHHDEYDSYILGCSSTSSFPKQALDRYFGASFYNLIMYGADMLDVEQTGRYLLDHYTVKNLVLNVYIDNGIYYNDESNHLTHAQPRLVSGESAASYYAPFLFASPSFGIDKLQKRASDGYLQAPHDVFDEKSGAYDKSSRDVERIGTLEEYLEKFPVFVNYQTQPLGLYQTENTMRSVAVLRDLCKEKGVNFVVVTAPVYYDYLGSFDRAQVENFYTALAAVTDYWDFAVSSVSREPRYFYDGTHFRNCVGEMALARMFGDESRYIPEDFGRYITKETVSENVKTYWSVPPLDDSGYTTRVPVLLYHHLAEEGDGGDTISASRFAEQMFALKEAGWQTVTFAQLSDYLEKGTPLPENAFVLTFDDGYDSNRLLAAPVLEECGYSAEVFLIGVSVGKDTYKDSGKPMIPHFSIAEAAELEKSGTLYMGTHGYDMHNVEGRDPEPLRKGAIILPGESEEAYIAFLREDHAKMKELFRPLGHEPEILAYPYGNYTQLSEVVLSQEGVRATLTTEENTNTLIKGMPQTLFAMYRYTITEDFSGSDLVAFMESAR